MKKLYSFIPALFFAFLVMAQNPVPNPSFETWNGTDPVSWSNSSDLTQSTDAHTGTYAAKTSEVHCMVLTNLARKPVTVRLEFARLER